MTVGDWLTIVAIVMGPIVGACLAIFLEDLRTKRERKLDVFRNLMRTRRAQLWVDHVTALNLVEVEFYGNKKVIDSFKGYIGNLTTIHPRTTEEEYNQIGYEERKVKCDEVYWRRFQKKRDELFVIMVHAIAESLGFKKCNR